MAVPTNQLLIELPSDWSLFLSRYSIRRYQLTKRQSEHGYRDKSFYHRFPNDYKNQFDHPFFYFTKDDPYPALYTLVPISAAHKPWRYPFGNTADTVPEEIQSAVLDIDEVPRHVLLKLMLALCFYETGGDSEQEYRVSQNKFFLWVRNSGPDFLIAVEVTPTVDELTYPYPMTLKVQAKWFAKAWPVGKRSDNSAESHFDLFHSKGHTYLRQLRPSHVATFDGDLYRQPRTSPGKNASAAWHNDGAKYKESRSYLVHHVQERFVSFLNSYGFRAVAATEPMTRFEPAYQRLPLEQFKVIQVIDNRLNKEGVSTADYVSWLSAYQYPTPSGDVTLPFKLVNETTLNADQPLLALQDVGAVAFGYDDKTNEPRLFTQANIDAPYQKLYKKLPAVVKQSLNVNYHQPEDFTVIAHYQEYGLPVSAIKPRTKAYWAASTEERLSADRTSHLVRNLEVCLTELWLKWVIAGKAPLSREADYLPFATQLSKSWGFMHDNLLLYFEQGQIQVVNLASAAGKQVLKSRFTALSKLTEHLMLRTYKDEEQAEAEIPRAFFVLVGQDIVFDIERTEIMAMPTWEAIKAKKREEAATSARGKLEINVYAGGIWYNAETARYIVSGVDSSAGKEAKGHHFYQIHQYGPVEASHLQTIISLLTVTFVRKNQFTVLPYPFDLIRLHQEVTKASALAFPVIAG